MLEEKLGLGVPLLNVNVDRVATVEIEVFTFSSPVIANPVPAWLKTIMREHRWKSERTLRTFVANGRFIGYVIVE